MTTSNSKSMQTKNSQPKKPLVPALKLQIDSEVTRSIRQHARTFMQTEVCGVLIGDERNGILEIEASIQASSAAQAGTHVTFTQDAWQEIYKVKDESYPDHRIVGWYHSHPGFGVFLSEHDTFIHRNFFTSPNQVAWVYDPHTDEEGCFGWFDGEIHRIPSISIVDLRGDGEERTPHAGSYTGTEESDTQEEFTSVPGPRRPPPYAPQKQTFAPLMNIAGYVSVAVLGFALSYFFFPSVIGIAVNPYTMDPLLVNGRPIAVEPRQSFQSLNPLLLPPKPDAPATAPAAQPLPPATPSTTPSAPPQTQPSAKPDSKPGAHQ
jgi:proteasome lid subunit RPN8/RPN11